MNIFKSGLTGVGTITSDLIGTVENVTSDVVTDVEELRSALIGTYKPDAPEIKDLDMLPGCEIVGSGYDVLTGFYADSKSCLTNLFAFPQLYQGVTVGSKTFAKPTAISYHSSITTFEYTSHGNSIEEYTSNVNSRTKVEGEYNFFSGSVELDIGKSSAESLEKQFSKVQHDVNLYTLQLPTEHKKYLTPTAKHDINNMKDLQKLYDTYGSHYVAGIMMGGSATYTSTTSKTSFQSSFSLSLVAQMAYKSVVGSLSASEEAQYGEDVKSFKESSETKLETKGGNPAYGGSDFPLHASDWSGSVIDYVAFVDFTGDRSLIPIWELALSAERAKLIKDYYPQYCKSKERKYDSEGPYLRAKVVPLTRLIYTDVNSGSEKNLAVCAPDIGSDWYYLGQVAFPGGNPKGYSLVVQELKPGTLVKVKKWEKVWDDAGSGKPSDYSLWRGVSGNPVEYFVLSDFFRGDVPNQNPPTEQEAAGIRAVHARCVVPGKVGDCVWTDAGSTANANGSVWKVLPNDVTSSIDMSKIEHYFVSNKDPATKGNTPPERPVYVLKKSAVVFV